MSKPDELLDPDFEAQLRGLFQQAERAIGGRKATERPPDYSAATVTEIDEAPAPRPEPPKSAQLSLPQLLRPVVDGLALVKRETSENSQLLRKLDASTTTSIGAQENLPQLIADLRALLESKNTVSQGMFAALHDELKSYKDGFLLDSVHRPLIRDLISLYDDTSEVHRQVVSALAASADASALGPAGQTLVERMRDIAMNLEHHMDFIAEVLNRLEATLIPPHTGKLDKSTQRAVAVELAEDPDEDTLVVRSVKRGVMWKDRLFRAEEVVIKKWKEGFLVALKPTP
jgi:molecular chaperone GrpE (heat shock protein)